MHDNAGAHTCGYAPHHTEHLILLNKSAKVVFGIGYWYCGIVVLGFDYLIILVRAIPVNRQHWPVLSIYREILVFFDYLIIFGLVLVSGIESGI